MSSYRRGLLLTKRQIILWTIALLVLVVPYIGLMAIGAYTLWHSGQFYLYGIVTAAITAGFFVAAYFYRKKTRQISLVKALSPCPEDWPPREREAWKKVEEIAQQAERGELGVETFDEFLALLRQLIDVVAKHYHPDQEDAYLRVPITDVLKISEKVTRELREVVQAHLPASHLLTIREWMEIPKYWETAQWLYTIYRIVTAAASPVNALWREFQRYITQRTLQGPLEQTKCELLAFVIRRAGFYLIELYAGRVILDDEEFTQQRRAIESQEWQSALAPPSPVETDVNEFVRVLIVGQVKAGKSSLVNALCKTWVAQTDVLPTTDSATRYRLVPQAEVGSQRGSGGLQPLPGALILVDTPGYETAEGVGWPESLWREMEYADMVLLLCSACLPARKADREFVRQFRNYFGERPFLRQPPLIVVCTFIDQLRPIHEWRPPYCLEGSPSGATSPKERSIWNFVEAVRRDLELGSEESTIPVCTHPERLYNVAEGLLPAINARWNEAVAVRRNRLVHEYRGSQKWDLLGHQVKNVVPHALRFAGQTAKRWVLGQSLSLVKRLWR